MVDAFSIGRNFEVIGSDGDPIGLVDELDSDGEVRLQNSDGEAGGKRHWIPLDWVTKVEASDMRILLNLTGDEAQSRWREESNDDEG
jgi:hypothetical protein